MVIEERDITNRNLIIACVAILFFVGIILLYYSMLYSEKRNNIITEGEVVARECADQIDKYFSTNKDIIRLAAYAIDEMIREKKGNDDIEEYLVAQSMAVKSAVIENSTGLYGYVNGTFFSGTNWEPPEDYDAVSRPWYQNAMANPGQIAILDPYHDMQSGNIMLAIGKALCDGDSVISVDISLDRIQGLTEGVVMDGDADLEMVLNDKGVVVAHSDREQIGRNYNEEKDTLGAVIAGKRHESGNGFFEFDYEGSSYIAYDADIQNGWCCITIKNATEVFVSLRRILMATVIVVIAIVVLVFVVMNRSNRYMHMTAVAMEANEAKSEFLSRMSHEIRTPINAVLGMNEMILRECSDSNILSYSENIRTAGKSLLGLVNDILDFSRIEAGRVELITAEYDLAFMIRDVMNMIRPRAQEKGLALELDIDPELPARLCGDEVRIKQIITNIMTNAVKYTERGRVTFRIGQEKDEKASDHVILAVSVRDTGIGIRQEDMKRLFSEFERIEEKRNRNVEGTGLGMSITKSLLEMMDSTLEVESIYGQGSTFSFRLRQKVAGSEKMGDFESRIALSQEESKHRERFRAPSARVLVVDDNPMNLLVFKSLVKQTEVGVDAAGGSYEGLLYAGDTGYDIIFLDHMMPDRDGIEVLHDIREAEEGPNAHTPAVCLTANAISGARKEYIAAGFDDYLTKPIDPDALEEMMLRFIPREKVVFVSPDDAGGQENGLAEDIYTEGQETDPGAAAHAWDQPGDPSGEAVQDILAAIGEKGIDIQAGIKNSGGIQPYMELLRVFKSSLEDNCDELDRLFEAVDYGNYAIRIHAMKSSARIIGAAGLGERAQKLEDAAKAGDVAYVVRHHPRFLDELSSVGDILSRIGPASETKGGHMAAGKLLDSVISDLKTAASEMDCDRIESILERLDGYAIPEERRNLFRQLREAAARFEYGTITDLLDSEEIT